jgi:hypothetical protein
MARPRCTRCAIWCLIMIVAIWSLVFTRWHGAPSIRLIPQRETSAADAQFHRMFDACMQVRADPPLPFAWSEVPEHCRDRIRTVFCARAAGLRTAPETSFATLAFLDPSWTVLPVSLVQPRLPVVRLAFAMLAHTDALQFHRLFHSLYTPLDAFAIHVDAYSPASFVHEVRTTVGSRSNVILVEPRENSAWGFPGITRATVALLRRLMTREWDFVINVSGSCYPLATLDEMRQVLAHRRGYNFALLEDDEKVFQDHPEMVECGRRMYYVGDAPRFKGTIVPRGSQWFVLSREFCTWAFNSLAFESIVTALESQPMSDERAIQAALFHSPFKPMLLRSNFRMALGRPRGEFCMPDRAKMFVGLHWCGRGPRTLVLDDTHDLTQEPAFFMRKVHSNVSGPLLDEIDRRRGTTQTRWSSRRLSFIPMEPFWSRLAQAVLRTQGHPGEQRLRLTQWYDLDQERAVPLAR